jgi:hypothetical protein
MAVTIGFCGFDQLLNLTWRQVFAATILAVGQSCRRNYRFGCPRNPVNFRSVNDFDEHTSLRRPRLLFTFDYELARTIFDSGGT